MIAGCVTAIGRRHALLAGLAMAAAPALPRPARGEAATYPSGPVRIVVPFAAGSTTDQRARIFAERMTAEWGQPFVVENRGGANGFLAAEAVIRARPDGHTVMFGSNTLFATNPAMFPRLPYDPVADFAPVTLMSVSPLVAVVNNEIPVRDLAEFIAYAKARPGRLNFASGNGSSRGAGELFKAMAGLDMVHIGYPATPQAMTDLIAGHVHLMVVDGGAAIPQVRQGRVRGLATTGTQRMEALPELPTVAEAAIPGYQSSSWTAVYVRAGTPPEILAKLHGKIAEIGRRPEISDRMRQDGSQPSFGPPEELGRFMLEEIERWRTIVRLSGMQPS